MALDWNYTNYNQKPLSPIANNVTIKAPPDTDIWRADPVKDNFTAPYLQTTIRASDFESVRVTITAAWKTLYDQGGLLITFPSEEEPLRWIKAGIEYADGHNNLGVVATDRLSDWSLSPITDTSVGNGTVTVEIERDASDVWVYVIEGSQRRALRKVTWAFSGGASQEIGVGIYAAKPTRESDEGHEFDTLAVSFSDFVLKTNGTRHTTL
ncbi:hypothetical protein N7449_011927 [Penicillium cf. viridicatum]|uniref:Uncharacterized protein n=1 Tax=Penicillium cf. viridicatum TaxID=2972119 RepID=A0A9W9LY05_9EURO|nr:hypothetical protein N7449_011927 [Penicillium cf. viridicatum]